ncbi:MAG: winged helix-turn-helix transcriptional regulator [Solirubrobacteraceae bacterium]
MADIRVKSIVCELARGPLQPSELQQRLCISRSTLYVRLRTLSEVGLLVHGERASFPYLVEYALTDPGRIVGARRILGDRRQSRELMSDRFQLGEDLLHIVRLVAPLSRVHDGATGVCTLQERISCGPGLELSTIARAGRLEVWEGSGPLPQPDATISARPPAWDDMLLTGDSSGLTIDGDRILANTVSRALHNALR